MFLVVRIATGRMGATVVTILAVASTLMGCSSGGTSSTGPSSNVSEAVGQAVIRGSGLASALDLIPDMYDGNVRYTDWSMLGHQYRNDPNSASFAGAFLAAGSLLRRDLGISYTDAQWELDVRWPSRAPLFLLGFGPHADLPSLSGKLTRLGFHAEGSSLFTGSRTTKRLWAYGLFSLAIDVRRHLLAESADVTALRSALAAPARPFGRGSQIVPLLKLASARLGRIATAAIAVGPAACVKLTSLMPLASRAVLARAREFFHGTFTPPQAEITALGSPAATAALDALTFSDQRTAEANRTSRSAASQVVSEMMSGGSTEIRTTGTAVTGRVLSLDLSASQPRVFQELVLSNELGVDICP